jgi:hypothetical protein
MAFSDPQSVTVNSVPYSLPRVGAGLDSSKYRVTGPTLDYQFDLSHSASKQRIRHLAKLTLTRRAADVYQPSVNSLSQMSAHLVVDVPIVGFTPDEQKFHVLGLFANLEASTNANLIKLIQGES